MNFRFDPEAHVYTLDGVRLPSVSEITRPVTNLDGIPPDVLAWAAARGTAVHAACHLLDEGRLDERSLDQRILGRVQAWRQFTYDHEPVWELSEEPLYHPVEMYAGTPDRYGRLRNGVLVGLDIKSVAKMRPATAAQLTGYARLIEAQDLEPPRELMGVNLRDDGQYEVHNYPFEHHLFEACLRKLRADAVINRWNEEHK